MRYTLLLYYLEADVESVGAEAIAAGQRDLGTYAADLDRAGVLVSAEVLQPSRNTTTLRMGKDKFELHDGSLPTGTAPLGAIVTIEVADRAAALSWAREAPAIRSGTTRSSVVEIRPSASHAIDGVLPPPEEYHTLRALADAGNEKALDRLADLTDGHGDIEGLHDLLDEGSRRAGERLTRRAAARGDLAELQRISDAGYEGADQEIARLLAGGMRP